MVKIVDHKQRQDLLLSLIVRSYVEDGKPVSSDALRQKFRLPYSSATIRNILGELEEQGYLCHVHTSSGRVPTQEGFRYYIRFLMNDPSAVSGAVEEIKTILEAQEWVGHTFNEMIDNSSRMIARLTHQAGLGLTEDHKDRMIISGTRFIFDYPEFDDIEMLRNLFTTLEERVSALWDFLNENVNDDVKVFIGDEISLFKNRSCAMIITPVRTQNETRAMFGVLGSMRMDYSDVIAKLRALRDHMQTVSEE